MNLLVIACPNCFRAGADSYMIATALMLALPVALIGGLVWWLRLRGVE